MTITVNGGKRFFLNNKEADVRPNKKSTKIVEIVVNGGKWVK